MPGGSAGSRSHTVPVTPQNPLEPLRFSCFQARASQQFQARATNARSQSSNRVPAVTADCRGKSRSRPICIP